MTEHDSQAPITRSPDYPGWGYGPDSVFGFEIDHFAHDVARDASRRGIKPEEHSYWCREWTERTPGHLYVFSDAHAAHEWATRERRGCCSIDRLPVGWTASEAVRVGFDENSASGRKENK